MRILPVLLVLAALVLAAPATAQSMSFDQSQVVRIGFGDIPTTDEEERAGAWNVRDQRTVMMEDGPLNLTLPTAAVFEGIDCECDHNVAEDGDRYVVAFPDGASGEAVVTFGYWFGFGDDRLAANLRLASSDDTAVILWVERGTPVDASVTVPRPLASTGANPGYDIYLFDEHEQVAFWVTAGVAPGAGSAVDAPLFTVWGVLVGAVVGMVLWALLVKRGVVQTRSRRQVASPAAHKEAGKEPKAHLEARKRALMAALKELEIAKGKQEVDQAAYDAVKADLKKQAVSVMRALEEAT